MGVGSFIHYVGTFFLLVSTVLLIIADISAPVIDHISFLRAEVGQNDVYYGNWGWCIDGQIQGQTANQWSCSGSSIGYNVEVPLNLASGSSNEIEISDAREATIRGLTHVMILHPIATVLLFIAFLLALGTNTVGSLISAIISGLGFLVTAVALICDFVGFSLLRRRIRDANYLGSTAVYGSAMWCVLAAACLSLIATILVFVTCCAGRRKARREHVHKESWNAGPPPATYPNRRRYFWQRR
ncbi:SUR7/PalI family-domain-containing protein [Stachybotrys elegans]|uniref:SUR7/PalI family-domain-containing protein n=1 Tax=Stachybotrys elegans TaxID=80388 RepID=A0A8K0T451_9HYPO|nr:SUR7/PalI family-domain-containing protein [Stachybotrys elegans]